jgi:hypothetical protein
MESAALWINKIRSEDRKSGTDDSLTRGVVDIAMLARVWIVTRDGHEVGLRLCISVGFSSHGGGWWYRY